MKTRIFILCLALAGLFFSCGKDKGSSESAGMNYKDVKTPAFSADSAYAYVKMQCEYGPRTPESAAAQKCGDWIIDFLRSTADTVYVQNFSDTMWNGKIVKGRNIIASFNTASTDRVVLASHWDSRLWADNDADSTKHRTAIIGANDGASGVGVLMEIARIMKGKKTKQGLDIVLFDLEDQGTPMWAESDVQDQTDWCLGSQYWSRNLHIPYYRAKYGILLDMVGSSDVRFTKEMQSMGFASGIMNNVWNVARDLGFDNVFVDEQGGSVMDDHIFVNNYAKIPMIDLVQNTPDESFFKYWHTTGDNLSCIDRKSLKIVGQVLLTTFFAAEE